MKFGPLGPFSLRIIIINKTKIMSYNSFDYYQQLREYQLHMQKISNPQTSVPSHEPYQSSKLHIDKLKELQRQHKILEIERENQLIMHKLVQINRRRPQISNSVPSLTLPPIKRQKQIRQYQQQNNQIAKKIIETKSSISTLGQIQGYKSVQLRKKNISKYVNQDGVIINRRKYLAELMLLKKMRMSELLK